MTVISVYLEDGLAAVAAGHWLVIGEGGGVEVLTDAEYHQQFDADVVDEAAEAEAETVQALIERRVAEIIAALKRADGVVQVKPLPWEPERSA